MITETNVLDKLMRAAVDWEQTDDVDYPYRTTVDEIRWRIRLNDFPDEPLFSLIKEDQHVADFDDWPSHWRR